MNVTGAAAAGKAAGVGRRVFVDRKRISAWSTGADLPQDQPLLEAVVKALLEALRKRQEQGRIDADEMTAGLLEERAWLSWWRAARDAPRSEPWLEPYLAAARHTAEAHPYPGVLPGSRLPPLSQVYVQQRSRPRFSTADAETGSPYASGASGVRLTAEAVVSTDHNVLLLGGPGAGKSSLLRHVLITLAASVRNGEAAVVDEVPVYVPAAYLTVRGLSFAEQVAAAARDELSGRRVPALNAEIFDRLPRPASRWLVLLDGLDEITDIRQRLQLTQLLGEHRAGPYRFVLTSRPLSEGELAALERDPHLLVYELLPFEPSQLRSFAEGWMRTAHDLDPAQLPDPEAAVHGFLAQATRPALAQLARTPLLATILCQLHAAGPGRALPRDRYSIYQNFQLLLRQRLTDPLVPELPDAILATLGRVAARQHHRHGMDDDPAADLLTEVLHATDHLCPPGMLPLDWTARREHLLCRTGLISAHGGTYTFIHQTIGEFLAARHVAADARLSRQASRSLYGWRSRRGLVSLSSYDRFLVAAWLGGPSGAPPFPVPPRLTTALHRSAGWSIGARYIAQLAADGLTLTPQTIDAATCTLKELATDSARAGHMRVDAARALADVNHELGHDLLTALAADPSLNGEHRVSAARELAELNDPHGFDLLAALATDSALYGPHRAAAALSLARSSDARAADLLAALATDPTQRDGDRVILAQSLTELADPRAADVWTALAGDPARTGDSRITATRKLAELGDQHVAQLWAALATDTTLSNNARVTATHELVNLDGRQAVKVWGALATDTTLYDARVTAARELVKLDGRQGCDLLAALPADRALSGHGRVLAAQELAALGDGRATDLLVALAATSDLQDLYRVRAAQTLAELADLRATEVWAALAADPTVHGGERVAAARELTDLDEARATDLLAVLAADTDLHSLYRVAAAQALAERDATRGSTHLAALATDPALDDLYGLAAAQALIERRTVEPGRHPSDEAQAPRWRTRAAAWIIRRTRRIPRRFLPENDPGNGR
ncbi:NACHT domain-containing NTPase [Nonomuraea sp. MTCD27]|uniref:NACHT domain-containing protein n=1 Tax=Nonomuraea sp. MTCD27 TaxID=1676747 RepID=UPI0035C21F96